MMASIIVLNTGCMALQVDNPDVQVDIFGFRDDIWCPLNVTFLTIFVLEIAIRLRADGFVVFFATSPDWGWNLFDFVVVFLGAVDALAVRFVTPGPQDAAKNSVTNGHDHATGNVVMAARIFRILRVLRVLRIFRAFKKLRMLARGLVEAIEVVSWIMVLVLVVLVIFAIVCTSLVGHSIDQFPEDEQDDIKMYWGSVARSMFTLFQFLTMDGWSEVYYEVQKRMPWMVCLFFPFVFFGAFVIMSLLTGVMADHMNDVRRTEEAEEHLKRVSKLETAVEAVEKCDINGDGTLDRLEFETLFDTSKSRFAKDLKIVGLQLRRDEASDLFDWFDVNGSNSVDHEELRNGIKNLFEGLTPLQLFKLGSSVRGAERFVHEHMHVLQKPWPHNHVSPSAKAENLLHLVDERLQNLEEETCQVEEQVQRMMENFLWKEGSEMFEQDD